MTDFSYDETKDVELVFMRQEKYMLDNNVIHDSKLTVSIHRIRNLLTGRSALLIMHNREVDHLTGEAEWFGRDGVFEDWEVQEMGSDRWDVYWKQSEAYFRDALEAHQK